MKSGINARRSQIDTACQTIRARVRGAFPTFALVLGSGLGPIGSRIENRTEIPYSDIPGFPIATVAGHAGKLLAGTLADFPVLCLQGRFHLYEGHAPEDVALPVRVLHALGIRELLLTNAAGGINPALQPGSLMLIEDHINHSGRNPLIGPNDDHFGPRFPDMSAAWDPALRQRLKAAAARSGVAVEQGVYLYTLGPNFETPAEIRAFRTLGADAVGMSTVPESLVANHCGMRVAGLSLITNLAAGIADHSLSHKETLDEAEKASARVEKLLLQFFGDMARA